MRIALATVGTTGDVRPFAALASRLLERGHDVTVVTWPVHRTAFAQPGIRAEIAGPHADAARIEAVADEAAERNPLEQIAVLRDFHLADGEAHYRRLRELLPGHDVVVLHGIHALAHAAVLDLGLRWATAVFDPVLLPTATAPPAGMPHLGPANRLLWSVLDRVLRRTGRPLDDLLWKAGSAQRGLPLFRARSPLLHLVACSPSIVGVAPDLPPTTTVTGAWVDNSIPDSLPAPVAQFLADGSAPIVIAFGSMSGPGGEELTAALEAILGVGRRVILQGSSPITSPSLLTVGAIDHRALFPRAAAVVHHGGAGTSHAVAAAGVPSVVVPHIGDQHYWADRLHRLGVAAPPMPVGRVRASDLAEAALATASDQGRRQRAQALAELLATEDGIGAAIERLEAVVERG